MEYYQKIKERDVWVTVMKPKVLNNAAGGYIDSPDYCAGFKYDKEPGAIVGEFLKDPNKPNEMKWFQNPDEAANAAFEEAEKRLNDN